MSPTSPAWFDRFLRDTPTSRSTTVEGARIAYLHWENPGAPGLVFVHGHAAHAHWWDFIAPAFHETCNVLALDLSGAGDSDHRQAYSVRQFAAEILACIDDAGLGRAHLVGHSFGGTLSRIAAWLHPDAFRSLVLVDSMIPATRGARTPPPLPRSRTRHYPTIEEAVRRFRLRPPQPASHDYIISHIARHSVRREAAGYVFKLDAAVFAKMLPDESLPAATEMIRDLGIPAAMIYGDHSRFFPAEAIPFLHTLLPEDNIVAIADAHHHVFLDQPLAFNEALAGLLADFQSNYQ
ncbi:MAG: alpha/beta hydrolase [Proteobacteria bacterium]|nr:alpha/beta hydrolase [Pseudomonadota bacterium]